jgi:hypothetical protein
MTNSAFLRTVLALWGDHWQQRCQALLAEHGKTISRQQLYNYKAGKTPVPEYVKLILEEERKGKKSAS